jgi:hypothetical protein
LTEVCERAEGLRIRHRELSEDLAIDLDVREFESVDQSAVRQAVFARCRVDSGDPECPEGPLSLFAIAIRVAPAVFHGLSSRLEQLAPCAVITLGLIEYAIAPLARSDTSFDSRHVTPPCSIPSGRKTAS